MQSRPRFIEKDKEHVRSRYFSDVGAPIISTDRARRAVTGVSEIEDGGISLEVSSHYYALLALCRIHGFDKKTAAVIAHASQFVDDAKVDKIIPAAGTGTIKLTPVNGKQCLYGMATCHSYMKMKTFNYYSMINNTCAFHFVPGGKGNEFTKKLRCREASPVITSILGKAVKINDPVRFGMLLHIYADTFSHQGFSGLLSSENDIKNLKPLSSYHRDTVESLQWAAGKVLRNKFDKFFDGAMPAYGHGQALTFPDTPYMCWSYEYDGSSDNSANLQQSGVISNSDRFIKAFLGMSKYLGRFYKTCYGKPAPPPQQKSMNCFLGILTTPCGNRKKIKSWRMFMVEHGFFNEGDPELKYDPHLWPREAFTNFTKRRFKKREVEGVVLNTNFPNSNWYRYYMAVQWYKGEFFKSCKSQGIDVPR
jgi:hypothetical protein